MSQRINLNTTPNQFMPILYFSQGDIGRTFEVALTSSDGYSIPIGATVEMVATKPSGFGFTVSGSLTGNVATFVTTETMTSEWGRFPAEIVIKNNGDVIGTANFYLNGERNPHPEGTIDGDASTIIPQLTLLVERVETAASSVLDRQTVTQTLPAGSQASYSFDEETNTQTFGIPQGEAGAGAVDVTASAYSSSKTYAVGDYVIHNDYLYRCTTAITTAEAWTSGHWTQVLLGDEVSDVKSDLTGAAIIRNVDIGTLKTGKYIDNNDGSEKGTATWSATDYIDISMYGGITVECNRDSAYNAYYDEDMEYISGFSVINGSTKLTIPNNAKYIRMSNVTANMSATQLKGAYKVSAIETKVDILSDDYNSNLISASSVGVVSGEYYNSSTGLISLATNWERTDYIKTPDTDTLIIDCRYVNTYDSEVENNYNWFFAKDYTPISRIYVSFGILNEIEIPENAYYYALSYRDSTFVDPSFIESSYIVDPTTYKYDSAIEEVKESIPTVISESSYLKFATWNTGLFNDGVNKVPTADAPAQMVKFRKTIGEMNADIINTNEWLQYFDAGNTYLSATVIGFKYLYSTATSWTASFSKIEPSNITLVPFTSSGSGRGYRWFNVTVGDKVLTIINTHLDTDVNPSLHRASQIQELIAFMTGKEYVILSGDFNVYNDSEYDAFRNAGFNLCNGGDFGWFDTWPVNIEGSAWGTTHLDNIITSSDIVPQYVEAIESPISDHAPILASLWIK